MIFFQILSLLFNTQTKTLRLKWKKILEPAARSYLRRSSEFFLTVSKTAVDTEFAKSCLLEWQAKYSFINTFLVALYNDRFQQNSIIGKLVAL